MIGFRGDEGDRLLVMVLAWGFGSMVVLVLVSVSSVSSVSGLFWRVYGLVD